MLGTSLWKSNHRNSSPEGREHPKIDDLDGDGRLDAAVVVPRPAQTGQSEFELKAISLHDGVSRWSRVFPYQGFVGESPSVEIGKRAVPTSRRRSSSRKCRPRAPATSLVHALDGRDGTDRWTWRSGVGEGDRKVYGGIDAIALDHEWKDSICVTYSDLRQECRIVILDPRGQGRVRVLPPEPVPAQMFPAPRRLHDRS